MILAAFLTSAAAAMQPSWLNRPAADASGEMLPVIVVQDVPIDRNLAELIHLHRYATSGQPDQRLSYLFVAAGSTWER